MKWGAGGRIVDHRMTFEGYFRAGTKVELRGPCYSACTLLLGYMEKANLCIAPGAFMAFHAVRGEKYPIFMVGRNASDVRNLSAGNPALDRSQRRLAKSAARRLLDDVRS